MNRRVSFTIVLSLVASFLLAQDLSKPVDYMAKALPLRLVAEELSKQGAVKLKVDAEMENEPIILRLNHVPLKEAMDKIADVFGADWVNHGDYLRLERSREKIQKIRQALFNERLAEVKKSQEKIRKSLETTTELDGAAADRLVKDFVDTTRKQDDGDGMKQAQLDERLPFSWLTRSILSSMDPAQLASVLPGRRAVFAFHPNRMQEPLPPLDPEMLARFERERSLVIDSFTKQVPQAEQGQFYNLQTMTDFRAPVADVVVASQPVATGDSALSLDITYSDSKGDYLYRDIVWLGWEDALAKESDYVKIRQQALKDGFELSPLAKEIAPRTLDRQQGEVRPLASDAVEFLLNPTRHDPISLATSEIVLTAAEHDGVNAVCLVPDAAEFYALNAARLGKTSLAAYVASVQRRLRITFSEGGGWIVVKPDDPIEAQELRMPRELLEKFIQAAYKQGYVSLDMAADLLGEAPLRVSDDLANRYVQYLMPKGRLISLGAETEMVRFLGKLSPEQRDAARRGTLKLRMSDLGDEQRAVANDMVFNALNAMQQEDKSPARGMNDHLKERTSFFPNGLPDETTVEITDHSEPAVFARESQMGGGTYTIAYPLSALAQILAESEHPELFRVSNPPTVEKLKMGSQRLITMRLGLGPRSASDSLREEHPADGDMVSIEDFVASLPADQRQKLETEIGLLLARQRQQQPMPATPAPTQGGGVKPPARRAA